MGEFALTLIPPATPFINPQTCISVARRFGSHRRGLPPLCWP